MWPVRLEWSTFSTRHLRRSSLTFLLEPQPSSTSINKQAYSSNYCSPSPPAAHMDRVGSIAGLEWWTIISGHPHRPHHIQILESAPPPPQSQPYNHLTQTRQSL